MPTFKVIKAESRSQQEVKKAGMSTLTDTVDFSYDSWGLTNPKSIESYRERTKRFKPYLLKMAKHVHELLQNLPTNTGLKPVWFLIDGTLLGAYRTGTMIEHDYDFDMGICFLHEDGTVANLEDCKRGIDRVGAYLSEVIDDKYTVATNKANYAYKIEVDEESTGKFVRKDGTSAGWSNVNLDIQGCYSPDGNKFKFAYFRDGIADAIHLEVENVLPLSEIQFESMTYPCPKETKVCLEAIYGYIGTPAKFNKETKKYEPV